MVTIMPPHQSENILSHVEELQGTLAKCQTMFQELDEHEKFEFNALENSFVSTTTELCEQLTLAHSNQTVSDVVTHDVLDIANQVARHVSEKKPIPPKKIEQILALNSDNIAPEMQLQHQKFEINAILELLKKMAILATVVLTIICPGPGTALGLGLNIATALVSFLPHAFEAYQDLFQKKQSSSRPDKTDNLVLDSAKQLQQAYKQESKEQRKNDPEETIKKENNDDDRPGLT